MSPNNPLAYVGTFKADTIKNSFAAAGLLSFNLDKVLEQLNIQLRTPTPPGSQSTNSALKTPYNCKQLEKQASIIKQLLRQHIYSPPSPSKVALNQLIKGCEIAMNSAVLLAKDNQDLCAVYEKQLQKGIRSKKQIAIKEGLSILFRRGQDLLQSENQADEVASTAPAEPAPEAEKHSIYAPPWCSDCHIIGHR